MTPCMVIAANMRRYRRALGMTQAELGRRMGAITGIHWSTATVSAAEHSIDGRRVRKFDADEIVALTQVLGCSILDMFADEHSNGDVGTSAASDLLRMQSALDALAQRVLVGVGA